MYDDYFVVIKIFDFDFDFDFGKMVNIYWNHPRVSRNIEDNSRWITL